MLLNEMRMTRRAMVGGAALLVGSAILPVLSAPGRKSVDAKGRDVNKSHRAIVERSLHCSCGWKRRTKISYEPAFDYNARFAADGQSVVFTSERGGDGNSDLFRCRINGTGIEPLVTGPAVEDAADLSPDGRRLAFVSTRNGYRANIWVMDLRNGAAQNLTGRRRRSDCPKCGTGMWLFGIEPDGPGHELLSFECSNCQHIETSLGKIA